MGASDCELLRSGLLVQPVNAVSSLAFVVAAIVVAWSACRPGRRMWRGRSLAFAGSLLLVGIGSLAYHGPQPAGAAVVHDVSIVLVLACLLVWRPRPSRCLRTGIVALGCTIAIAGGLYLLGRTGSPACDPASLVQWHAGWHVAAATVVVIWWWLSHGTTTIRPRRPPARNAA